MRSKILLVIVAILLLSANLFAQDQAKVQKPSAEDMQKMMAEFQKLGAPGPEHKLLSTLSGEWINHSKMWMGPDAKPIETSPGVHKGEMFMGGRFLRFTETGDMMGQPMEGLGIMGYDKSKQQYTMMWIDVSSTSMYTAAGTADADGKTITLLGKVDNPMTNEKDKDVKYIYRFESPTQVVFEMWDMANGQFYKSMETTYTKK
jgi:hypothetical protein